MKEELMELIRNMVADDEMELTEDSEFVDDLGLSSIEFFRYTRFYRESGITDLLFTAEVS